MLYYMYTTPLFLALIHNSFQTLPLSFYSNRRSHSSLLPESSIVLRPFVFIFSLTEFEGKPEVNNVTIFERLGSHEFLTQLSIFADLVLFNAGHEGYAKPLVASNASDIGHVFFTFVLFVIV